MSEENASPADENAETVADAENTEQLTDEEKHELESKEAEKPEAEKAEGDEKAKEEKPEDVKSDDPPQEPAKPKRSRAKERIEGLVSKAKELEAKVQQQEKRIAAYEGEQPDPNSYDAGEYDPQFVADLAVYKAAQKGKENSEQELKEAQEQAKAAQAQAVREQQIDLQERIEDFKESIPDFDEVAFGNLEARMSEPMAQMVMESEVAPQLLYYLGKNPKESADVSRLVNEREIAKRIGGIEARLSAPVKPRKQSQAPAPVKAVAETGSSQGFSAESASVNDMESYLKKAGVLS